MRKPNKFYVWLVFACIFFLSGGLSSVYAAEIGPPTMTKYPFEGPISAALAELNPPDKKKMHPKTNHT